MDNGENDAQHAIAYLNAQLQSLFDISCERVARRGNGMKPEPINQYPFALAECYIGRHRLGTQGSVDDMMFHARFEAPEIDFICSHEALFKVKIEEGHYNLDYLHASDESIADRSRNRRIGHSTFSFRVPFGKPNVIVREPQISNGEVTINVIVLDFSAAKMAQVTSEVDLESHTIETYLYNYLQLLRSAGHHVLFSLPSFDDGGRQPCLDFSRRAHLFNHDTIHGVSVEQINAYLSASWSKAAVLASSRCLQPDDRPTISLAEYRSTWALHDSGIHFHLKFGTPRLAALCDDEVLVYFDVEEVRFYSTEEFDRAQPFKTFANWKVAVLMDIIHKQEDGGNVTLRTLDLTKPRFMQQFSDFGNSEYDGHCKDRVISFVTGEYLSVLESAHHHIVYRHDVRRPDAIARFNQIGHHAELDVAKETEWTAANGGEDSERSRESVWREIAQKSNMCDVDQITALSQFSINSHLRSAWSEQQSSAPATGDRSLVTWSYQDYFRATFKPMTIHLRRNGRAIVFVHINEGFLKPLKNYVPNAAGQKDSFSELRVAFEVDIKMCDHEALPGAGAEWRTHFSQSASNKVHGGDANVKFKHIYLDLQSAECLPEACRLDGLFAAHNGPSVEKVRAIVMYLHDFYLKLLAQFGYHVLCTIPVWTNPATAPTHGLTSVAFHIYSEVVPAVMETAESSQQSEPIITILGMYRGRSLPTTALQYSADWVAHAGKKWSHGTVSVSNDVFLRERLLPLLSDINAATTIVPEILGSEKNKLRIELSSWLKLHPNGHVADCSFSPVPETGDAAFLRYHWRHHDDRSHNHRSAVNSYVNGVYQVFTSTTNTLEIPTTFVDGGLKVKLAGRVDLELSGRTGSWRAKTTAEWNASLLIDIEGGELRVSAFYEPTRIRQEQTSPDLSVLVTKPMDLLKNALPNAVDLTDVAKEFKVFDGVWQSCYPRVAAYSIAHPVFNRRGDLLFELQPWALPVFNCRPNGQSNSPQPTYANGNNTQTGTQHVVRQTYMTIGRNGSSTSSRSNSDTLAADVDTVNMQLPPNNDRSFTVHKSYSVHDGFGSSFDKSFDGFPRNGTFGTFTTESRTYPATTSAPPPRMNSPYHPQFEQTSNTSRTQRSAGTNQQQTTTSTTGFEAPFTANDHPQQPYTSTFTIIEEDCVRGVRSMSSHPNDFPSSNIDADARTPGVRSFTTRSSPIHAPIPDTIQQHLPPQFSENFSRAAAGMTSSGYSTTTTSSRSSTPQIFTTTTRSSTPGNDYTAFEERQQSSSRMGGGMDLPSMLGRTMGFGGAEIWPSIPTATRSFHSTTTTTGGSTMRREEKHFSSGSSSSYSQGGWSRVGAR